jgi:hypothetical protein
MTQAQLTFSGFLWIFCDFITVLRERIPGMQKQIMRKIPLNVKQKWCKLHVRGTITWQIYHRKYISFLASYIAIQYTVKKSVTRKNFKFLTLNEILYTRGFRHIAGDAVANPIYCKEQKFLDSENIDGLIFDEKIYVAYILNYLKK